MVRYFMSYTVPTDRQQQAREIINRYFNALQRGGPGGMRSQCYATREDQCCFVHIKSFRKESVARNHFRSSFFLDYVKQLSLLCGYTPVFTELNQQQTFESIY